MTAPGSTGPSRASRIFTVLLLLFLGLLSYLLYTRWWVPTPVAGPTVEPGQGCGPRGGSGGWGGNEDESLPLVTILAARPGRMGLLDGAKGAQLYRDTIRIRVYGPDPQKGFQPMGSVGFGAESSLGRDESRTALEAVVAGEFDGVCLGEPLFLEAVDKGVPVVAVASLGQEAPRVLVTRKGLPIISAAALRGKTLGVADTMLDAALLRAYLRSLGLDPDRDVKLVASEDPKDLQRLLGSAYDGVIVGTLWASNLVRDGKVGGQSILLWSTLDPGLDGLCSVLVFRKDFAREHHSEIAAVVEGLTEVADARIRSGGYQTDRDPRPDVGRLARLQAVMVEQGLLSRKTPLEGVIDTQFLKGWAPGAASKRGVQPGRGPAGTRPGQGGSPNSPG